MKFIFGTYLENSIGTYKNIIKIYNRFIYGCNEDLILDFSNTKRFESNLMAVLYLVIEDAYKKNIDVKFILPDNKEYVGKDGAYKCFNYYTDEEYRRSFFKPRCIAGNPNTKEVEDVLTKFLFELDLCEQDKISIIISELIANIKMHVINRKINCKGFMSSTVIRKNSSLYITIVNNGRSIRNILIDNGIIFNTDIDAIYWILKKTNSTRRYDETGGLGLYLVRKYISELGGDIIICSGSEIISLENGG